jgi:hypothetical protein
MGIFDQMLTSLVGMDFFTVLFPFLLALAIFWGVLTLTVKDRLGKGPIALVSIILSFFVMLYAKQIPGLSMLLTAWSGTTLMIATALLFVIIILGIFGIKTEDLKDRSKIPWISLLILIVIVYAVIGGVSGIGGINLSMPWLFSNMDVWAIVVFLIVIAIAWHFMTSEKKDDAAKPATK